MQFSSLNLRSFKRIFILCLIVNLLVIAGSYLAFIYRLPFLQHLQIIKSSSAYFSIVMGLTFIHILWQKRQLEAIDKASNFEEKVVRYSALYRNRLYWLLLWCMVSCVLFLLSYINTFFYFALIVMLFFLPYYPYKFQIQKELKDDDIRFR
jgi:hypothetical protein